MPLCNPTRLLKEAQKRGIAIPAFNIHNLETLQAVACAAQEARSPIFIAATPGTLQHAGVKAIAALANIAADESDVPMALHVDHCPSFELITQCIAAGFTSVMIDSSKLDYAQNVEMVRRVVAIAHEAGVAVEGEIGKIGGVEDDLYVHEADAAFTVPKEAQQFVRDTGIDSLAIAIGTAHGEYKGEPKLDFERISQIAALVSLPLVLHGASGVPDEAVQEALRRGMCKVNIATELKGPMAKAIQDTFAQNPRESDPRAYMGNAKKAIREVVLRKIDLCGSRGLADSFTSREV